jgi:hypothetical protein
MKQLVPVAALAALLAISSPAAATTFVRVSDADLVAQAPAIVVARVEARTPAAGRAATEYRMRIEETLKGEVPAEIVVRVAGGGSGPLRLKVFGAPSFATGRRALLFLTPGGDGTWGVQHLFLGAFHEAAAGDRRLAVRNLTGLTEVRLRDGALERASTPEPVRDFDAFARWIANRVRAGSGGVGQASGYTVTGEEGARLRRAVEPFNLFEDPDDGRNLRWFQFDTGGNVSFRADTTGQGGLASGGFTEFQTALAAWNAESTTPVDYRYAGKTSDRSGLVADEPPGCDPDPLTGDCGPDTLNSIVFGDPNNEIPGSFNCASGGVLAFGGPWYSFSSQAFRGKQYHPILFADIVVNDGLTCFFTGSGGGKAAEELFGHELGHTLGLHHSCGDPDLPDEDCNNAASDAALMRAFVHDDGRGAQLGSDDRAGLQSLYQQAGGQPAAPTLLTVTAEEPNALLLEWNDNATNEDAYVVEFKTLGGTFQQIPQELSANVESAEVVGLAEATAYVFRVRARNGSGFSGYSNEAKGTTMGSTAPCVEDADTLCLNGNRFRVEVRWRTSTASGNGTAIPLAADSSGLFWFFGIDNIEMLVKVLDGCVPPVGLPPRWWVFYAATTDQEFTLTVTDTQTGQAAQYFNALGVKAPTETDTLALDACQ